MKKLFILGDNLGGGSTLLASTIIEEASCDSSVIELRGWISPRVDVLSFSKFQHVRVNNFLKFFPRWIRRALIVKSLGDGWIILNLTNFPVSKLGVQPGTIEVCLFHNAYFFSTPNGIHNPIPAYFFFREIFLRRALLKWLMQFYDENLTKIVVQTHFMKKLATKFFDKKKIYVGGLHAPPMMESSAFTGDLSMAGHDVNNIWFYPSSAEPHKNHLVLIDIVKKSISAGGDPKIFITITPRTKEERDIIDIINGQGLSNNIINIGWVSASDRQRITANARGVLFLSTFESLGIALLEARLLCRPILCVDSPIAREILGDTFDLYDITRLEERKRFALDLTANISCLPIAHKLIRPLRIIDSYCFSHLPDYY